MEPTDATGEARPTGEVLHGGMQRLPVRQLGPATEMPQQVSWYQLKQGAACRRHVHTGKTETWLVIDGFGIAVVGEGEVPVSPGDILVSPPGVPHGLRNTGEGTLRLVNIVAREGEAPVSTRELADDEP